MPKSSAEFVSREFTAGAPISKTFLSLHKKVFGLLLKILSVFAENRN
jgi:hypothetical protein